MSLFPFAYQTDDPKEALEFARSHAWILIKQEPFVKEWKCPDCGTERYIIDEHPGKPGEGQEPDWLIDDCSRRICRLIMES